MALTKIDSEYLDPNVTVITEVDSGFSDTVQTSTTQTISNSTNYTNTSSSSIGAYGNYLVFNTGTGGNWSAGLTALQGLSSGDTFTVNFTEDTGNPYYNSSTTTDTVYVFSSATVLGGGAIQANFSSYTGTHPPMFTNWLCSFTIGGTYTARIITGSNNPIWDTTLSTVKIGSTSYSTDDWTVSGTQATHNSAAPTIAVGDVIEQVDAVHSFGASGDARNSVTLHGADTSLTITDGTSSLSLGIGPATFPSTVTAAEKIGISSAASGATWNIDVSEDRVLNLTEGTRTHSSSTTGLVVIGYEADKLGSTRSSHAFSVIIGSEAAYNGAATQSSSGFTNNVAIGYQCARNIGLGGSNVAIGAQSLTGNYSGSPSYIDYNVAIGYQSMSNVNGTGVQYNTCVGRQSGRNLNNGDFNTCIGNTTGTSLSSGRYNVLLGHNAGTAYSPSGAITTQNGVICLGDNNATDFYCNDTTISSSDSRDKTDVENLTLGLDFIQQLRPVTYRWDKRSSYLPEPVAEEEETELPSILDIVPDGTHKQDRLNVGFLAQEVEAIEQSYGYGSSRADRLFVNLNEDETAYGLKYERLVPVLVNAVKELSATVAELQEKVTALENAG